MTPILIVLVGLALVMLSGLRVLREYERAVVFRLGRARRELVGPGLVLMLPMGLDRARVVDLRTKVIQISPQEVITHDNISIVVDAVVYITVESPAHAILDVEQYMPATLQLAATTLRAVIGRTDLDDILAHRDEINEEVRNLLDARTEQWGIDISAVELRDITLPQEMKRAMARQAEAERERRAKVIAAEGEMQAAARLGEAAEVIAKNPGAMQLRMYQALTEMAAEPAAKIVVPIPVELLSGLNRGQSVPTEQIVQMVQQVIAGQASATEAAGKALAQGGEQAGERKALEGAPAEQAPAKPGSLPAARRTAPRVGGA
jgi:regulator of protease activity HflC (stomatin/prohibitin superfamily)